MLAIGLMSGTSLDGVDAALVEIHPRGQSYAIELVRFVSQPYEPQLRAELLQALPPNEGKIKAAAQLHNALGHAYARAALAVRGDAKVDYVASHGQTLWHDGSVHVTFQLGDAFVIRDAMDTTVVYDFRSADCAAGGQGAPLVPYVDALLLGDPSESRVALNLGGIANITLLRAGAAPEAAFAFDTGPANMLLDALIIDRTDGRLTYDRDGAFAAAGRVDDTLLTAMLADEYFAAPPPKTTGRERFGAQFLAQHSGRLKSLSLEDAAATLTELTALSIAQAVDRAGFGGARVIAAGGGVRNPTLLSSVAERLAPARVESSDAMGIPADAKEAIAFAVLGYEALRGRPANVPAATGAERQVVLGAVAPHDLSALLTRIETECAGCS